MFRRNDSQNLCFLHCVEYITGGIVGVQPLGASPTTVRTGGAVDSYTLTQFDNENRPIAEMQSIPGFVTAIYDATLKSFKVTAVGSSTTSP